MAKYAYHRVDANAEDIIGWWERHGASVARCGRPVDVIVGFAGLSVLAEIKTLKGPLRPSQARFLLAWRGAACVVRTKAHADELLRWMQRCADCIPDTELAGPIIET